MDRVGTVGTVGEMRVLFLGTHPTSRHPNSSVIHTQPTRRKPYPVTVGIMPVAVIGLRVAGGGRRGRWG